MSLSFADGVKAYPSNGKSAFERLERPLVCTRLYSLRGGGSSSSSVKIRGGAAGKSEKLPCPVVEFPKIKHCPGSKFFLNKFLSFFQENAEMLKSKRYNHIRGVQNGLKRLSTVNNEKYGSCHGADYAKMTHHVPESISCNDTLISGKFL